MQKNIKAYPLVEHFMNLNSSFNQEEDDKIKTKILNFLKHIPNIYIYWNRRNIILSLFLKVLKSKMMI